MTSPTAIEQCRDTARRHDRPHYLAALFLPARARDRAFAGIAFNHELSRIAHVVSEPLLGEMRLQWWRDAVTAPAVPDHPVLQAIATTGADRAILGSMIDARAADVYPEPCADMAALEAYAAATNGALLALWQHDDGGAQAAARSLGTAWGLMSIVNAAVGASVPSDAARGKALIPQGTAPIQVVDRAAHYLHRAGQQATLLPPDACRGLRLSVIARRELAHIKRHLGQHPLPPRFDRLDALRLVLGR